MTERISIEHLKELVRSNTEYAFFDVREPMEYDGGHIFWSNNLQRSSLEFRISELVPLKNTKIVLCDDDGRRSALSAQTLERNGYTDVSILDGNVKEWEKSGNLLVKGIYVPSKAFGEQVAMEYGVPQISPEELKGWREQGKDAVLFEVRPHSEVETTGSIPGAINIPGVELPIRIFDYDDRKNIVVTCAGRTRSLIAAQTLRFMGFKNVYDLKGGTMAWVLSGLKLDKDVPKSQALSESSIKKAELFARRLAQGENIELSSCEDLHALIGKSEKETLYLLDVRSGGEYAEGHIPNSIPAPGGQAIQIADEFIAVRNGNIVFIADENARAVITAFWYKKMGYPKVFVLDGGINTWRQAGLQLETKRKRFPPLGMNEARKRVKRIDAANLKTKLEERQKFSVIDVDLSRYFRDGHVPGAQWISRGSLELGIKELVPDDKNPVVVSCHNALSSTLAGSTLMDMGFTDVTVLDGGTPAWQAAGYPLEKGLTGVKGRPDDIWIPPYKRGREEMQEYLDWEEKLIEMGGRLT